METREYEVMARAENGHWWYASTRAFIRTWLTPFIPSATTGKRLQILDIGCGTGSAGGWLSELGHCVGLDVSVEALSFYRDAHEGHPEIGSAVNLPHPDNAFDAVVCVTVLYHDWILQPADTVAEFVRVLKPGGVVLLLEPGVRWLRRAHDREVMTARRFNRTTLKALFNTLPVDVHRVSGLYTFLVPPAAMLSVFQWRASRSDLSHNQSGGGGLALRAARAERSILEKFNLPTGLSVVAVAVKQTN